MTTSQQTPANWYPDPYQRYEQRWFDGSKWTEHVVSGGQQYSDPAPIEGGHHVQIDAGTQGRVAQQVQQRAGIVNSGQGGGTIWTEPVLVVNQKAKLIELTNEYAVFDQSGNQIGSVRQVGQSTAKKVLRVLTSVDQFLTHKLAIYDNHGAVQLQLTRPRKVMKSKIIVQDAQGREIGLIRQENMVGKIRFALEAGGSRYGTIQGENWRAWNFAILDHTNAEVARITKTWEGLARTMFTTADNYVVQIHRQLDEPLRSMVIASALSVDTALKQDSRGFG